VKLFVSEGEKDDMMNKELMSNCFWRSWQEEALGLRVNWQQEEMHKEAEGNKAHNEYHTKHKAHEEHDGREGERGKRNVKDKRSLHSSLLPLHNCQIQNRKWQGKPPSFFLLFLNEPNQKGNDML